MASINPVSSEKKESYLEMIHQMEKKARELDRENSHLLSGSIIHLNPEVTDANITNAHHSYYKGAVQVVGAGLMVFSLIALAASKGTFDTSKPISYGIDAIISGVDARSSISGGRVQDLRTRRDAIDQAKRENSFMDGHRDLSSIAFRSLVAAAH